MAYTTIRFRGDPDPGPVDSPFPSIDLIRLRGPKDIEFDLSRPGYGISDQAARTALAES